MAARVLARITVADIEPTLLEAWCVDTTAAVKQDEGEGVAGHASGILVHDNAKLPELVMRLEHLPLPIAAVEVIIIVML